MNKNFKIYDLMTSDYYYFVSICCFVFNLKSIENKLAKNLNMCHFWQKWKDAFVKNMF